MTSKNPFQPKAFYDSKEMPSAAGLYGSGPYKALLVIRFVLVLL